AGCGDGAQTSGPLGAAPVVTRTQLNRPAVQPSGDACAGCGDGHHISCVGVEPEAQTQLNRPA
ncbi:hypothetical protein, partial [Rhizobium ruizarguesonis]|uniref:hypothetical protein n=1 Tax=Rhizobium ruizarguesonis TaxID=2081791 RepID=UPI001A8FDF23